MNAAYPEILRYAQDFGEGRRLASGALYCQRAMKRNNKISRLRMDVKRFFTAADLSTSQALFSPPSYWQY